MDRRKFLKIGGAAAIAPALTKLTPDEALDDAVSLPPTRVKYMREVNSGVGYVSTGVAMCTMSSLPYRKPFV